MSDPEIVRKRATRGWGMKPELTAEEANRVISYLADGDPRHLEGTVYEAARRQVLAELTPKKPRPEAEPLSAEELLKLVPGVADVELPEVKMFSSETALFFLVVDENHDVVIQSRLDPREVLAILHAVMHDVQDAIDRQQGDG